MHMGTNSSTDKNAKSSNKCFRPQGIWDNKTISSSHENWYWTTQTLEAKQLSHFSQYNYFSIIKIKTSDWFPDFIFLVPVKGNRRSSGQSERVCVFIKINFATIQFNKNTSIIHTTGLTELGNNLTETWKHHRRPKRIYFGIVIPED